MKTKLDRYDLSILMKGLHSMRNCYDTETRDRIYDLLLRQHEKNRTWYLQVPRSVLSFLWKVSKNSMKDTVAGTTDPICQGFVFST